ncbi:DUF3158 family protein [[Pasteurella] aerogenes]
MKIMRLLPDNVYRDLAQESNLNTFFREFFGDIETVADYQRLEQHAIRIRDKMMDLQVGMRTGLRQRLPDIPLVITRDTSRTGVKMLRWKNLAISKAGQEAWRNIVTDQQYPKEARQILAQCEKDRILLNMQISIMSSIIRQLHECSKKLSEVEKLDKEK